MRFLHKLFSITLIVPSVIIAVIGLASFAATKIPEIGYGLRISEIKNIEFDGGSLKIEKQLTNGSNYRRYIVSYNSGGLRQQAYLTMPVEQKDKYPVLIFVHGYQVPELYTPDGNYIQHLDAFSVRGFIVLKPDLRGHGQSRGNATSAYFSPDYAIDVLNAAASLKSLGVADMEKIGIFGHSMGAHIVLRVLEAYPNIKAGVLWNGVTGSLYDIAYNWQDRVSYVPDSQDLRLRVENLGKLEKKYGRLKDGGEFWRSADPLENVSFIKTPLLIQYGMKDNQVPNEFTENLILQLEAQGKTANKDFFVIGDAYANHDMNPGFETAIAQAVDFFEKYLK